MVLRLGGSCLAVLWIGACSFPDYDFVVASELCMDGRSGASETGVDCGGICPPCGAGQGCAQAEDCASGLCADGICQVPGCDDGVVNGSEQDVDCGGTCRACEVDQRCQSDFDCVTGVCAGFCQAAQCDDGVRNGDESATDCGGGCDPCADGRACNVGADCESESCIERRCLNAGCMDGVPNGGETDVDCGGGCAQCSAGKACASGQDCESLVCANGQCELPQCDDEIKNGDEADLDCGGVDCEGCAVGRFCRNDGDCASNSCQSDWCVPASATGLLLPRIGWTASAATAGMDTPAAAVLDGQATRWTSGANQIPGMYFDVDMQERQFFFEIHLDATSNPDDAAAQFHLYISEDGTFDQPVRSAVMGAPNAIMTFDRAQVGRYLRFELTNGKDNWWSITEIRVYE